MYQFPDIEILNQGLANLNGHDRLTVVSRRKFVNSSTFPVEIITCRSETNKEIELFGKYLGGKGPNNFGHRGGVDYETKIYSQILSKISLSNIAMIGSCSFDENENLLLLEYLGDDLGLTKSEDPEALTKAASWIGAFHAMNENNSSEFIIRYSREYYTHWANRFIGLTPEIRAAYPWLDALVNFYLDNLKILLDAPQTIIHGEYYPKNILLKDGIIYPIDWESAAIAAGEIDLASLMEGWDEDPANAAKNAYIKARRFRKKEAENEFESRLLLAKIYFYLWWWPDKMDLSKWKENSYRFNQALQLSKKARVFREV